MVKLVDMIRSCPHCTAENRVPSRHLADQGRCGRCKNVLPPLSEPVEADPVEFDDIIANARVPVLVDFWAEWCAPCRMVAPEVKRAAQKLSGKVVVLKVNTEAHPELARRYHVQAIPNFVVFRDGQPVRQQAGAVDHRAMRSWIEEIQSRKGAA